MIKQSLISAITKDEQRIDKVAKSKVEPSKVASKTFERPKK